MTPRAAAAVSWTLAILAGLALAVAGLLTYADRTLFRSDAFADRAAATLEAPSVRAAAARRMTNIAVGARPDLVALRPLVQLGASGLAGTAPFRSLVRRAALEAHRSAFEADRRQVALTIRDAGILVADAVRALRPDAARRVPTGWVVRVARIRGGVDAALLRLAEVAENAPALRAIALGLTLLAALGAALVARSARAAALRLGVAVAGAGALVALAAWLGPALAARGVDADDRAAVDAAVSVWLEPLVAWALAVAAVGAVVALAAAAIVRPLPLGAIARRAAAVVVAPPRNGLVRVLRLVAAVAAGVAMVAAPRAVLTAAIAVVGALLVVVAAAQLLALAAGPRIEGGASAEPAPDGGPSATADGPPPGRARRAPRTLRAAAAALLIGGVVATTLVASGGEAPAVVRAGRCNGHAALCDRRLDEVAFLGTHNAMSAAGEPGWFFAAQDAGIAAQLDAGVRALLIDTHYGIVTQRGVATDLSAESKTRAKIVEEVGEEFVATAERIGGRLGRPREGKRAVFLCHTLCEVGATKTVPALRDVHRFLVRHPEEVLILSIQDETTAGDTAAAIRDSGLVGEVYRGAARPPWPTLREMIDRDERVLVLAENRAGGAPWIHPQPEVMRETPFRFRTEAELDARDSCRANRGGTAGSLLLVNHWVDTSPAPRVTIARRVNERGFLTRRLDRCRSERRLLPNVVAIDFFRQGDVAQVVDDLNDVG